MSFAIYRTAKLKSMGEIGGSLSHTYRTRPTPNADENKLHLNKHIFETYNQCFDALKNAIPEKRRSNAVLCVEHLITASPDWNGWGTEKESEFFKKSVEFLNKKYGKENVIACSIHRDETTPHLIVYIVPIDEKGGLNAKKWLGGRSKLSQTQTEFANEVKHFGLERGLENSKARHKTIKQFYAEIEKPTPKLKEKKYEIQPINYDLMPKMGFLETTSSFNKKLETSYNDIHLIYENQMLRLKEGHGKILQNAVDTYEKKLVENRLKIEKLSNENSRLKSDKKLITQGFEKKIELLEKEKTAITNDKLKSLREFDSFSQLKKIDPRAFQRLEIDVVDVVNQHKNAREAERKAEAEKHYREQQRIENERRAALKQKEENHRAWLFNRILERKEGGFSHDLIALSNKSQNTSEKNAIAELLDFRKSEKPVLKNKHFEYRLQEIRSGNLNGLDEFTHAIQWATNGGVIDTIFRFNLDSNTDWNDERAGKEVFNLFENISTVIEKELEKTKYSEVEKIKKLADFGDLVREKTDSLYCDYLQKRLTPFYEREERRKEHLEAMRKIDPNYMRSNSHSEFERNKPKPSPGNDFSM
jgi:hypothetical protein